MRERTEVNRMNPVTQRMRDTTWSYAPFDARAVGEMTERLVATARAHLLITYSNVVTGVEFRFATVNNGRPFTIDVHHWRDLDRQIVGDLLGWISMQSYE